MRKIIPLIIFFIVIAWNLPLFSADPYQLTKKGVELSDKKFYDEAIIEFKRAIEIYNSSSAKAYHNMGQALELKGDYPQAIVYYEEALKRNPLQVDTYQRIGYMYFKTADYDKAVTAGEYVIKVDPNNAEVWQWLPDAYKLKLQKQQEMLLAKQREEELKKKQDALKKKEEEEKAAQEEAKKRPKRIIYTTFDFLLRTGYYFDDSLYKFISVSGPYSPCPEMLYVDFTPHKNWEFDLKMGTPYLGALMPEVVTHTEVIQAMFHMEKYMLGLGFMGNHYKDDFNFDTKMIKSDYKIGVLFGLKEEKSVMNFILYPRFLPHDTAHSKGKTLDTDYYEFNFKYKSNRFFSYYSRVSAAEYFFFDHTNEISNYYGVYELCFGASLNKYSEETKREFLTFSLEFIEKFYMRNLNNTHPYKVFNGQGWFGMDSSNWFKGRPISGFYTLGHVLGFRIDEQLNEYISLYQKFSIELAGDEGDHNEFSLLLGASGQY